MSDNQPTGNATATADTEEARFEESPTEKQGPWLEQAEELPRRPRRRLLTPISAVLIAALLVAIGFIAGSRIEKQETSESSPGLASSAGGGLTGGGAASAGGSSAAAGAGGGQSGGGFGAGAGGKRAAGSGAGAQQSTTGTVANLTGDTLYLTTSEGNTVKVNTSASTSVSKTTKATVKNVHPGESVTVIGSKGAGGTVTARSVTIGEVTRPSGGLGGIQPSGGATPGGPGGGGGPPGGGAPFGP